MDKTFDKKDELNLTATSLWRPIFNHVNKSLEETYREAGKACFATTHYMNEAYMIKEENEWIGLYWWLLETYIGQRCLLIGL